MKAGGLGAGLLLSVIALCAGRASAQDGAVLDLTEERPALVTSGLALGLDGDDDDEDGALDLDQESTPPADDLFAITIRGRGPVLLRVGIGLRVLQAGGTPSRELRLSPRDLPARVLLQGTVASQQRGDRRLVAEYEGREVEVPVTVVATTFLDALNSPYDPTRQAARVSHSITNDATLRRDDAYHGTSRDPDDLRIEVRDPTAVGLTLTALLQSGPPGQPQQTRRRVTLRREQRGQPFRSPFIRLVGDVIDEEAPGVEGRVLRVGLRDQLRIVYPTPSGPVGTSLRVGRPGIEDGPSAARRGRLRIRVLRHRDGGVPAVGGDDRGALRIARDQVSIANEIWVQCAVGFGAPGSADIEVVDPPPASLLAIGDGDGLPAWGGGVVRFRVNGRPVEVSTSVSAPPIQTALAIGEALRRIGFVPEVTENPRTEFGAGRSADVVVRTATGELATLTPNRGAPLSTDRRQGAAIGAVDLRDGLREFDNMTAAAGTLEERALIKTLGDDDPGTIDLFIVNRFTNGTRQGEAFIEADGSAIINTLILDRNGIRQQREAWTQSHEIGHILMDMPFHPDNVGPDRPWLLMDADSSQGLVTGPKRLTRDECHRARNRSGVNAVPTILGRHEDEAARRPARPARRAR